MQHFMRYHPQRHYGTLTASTVIRVGYRMCCHSYSGLSSHDWEPVLNAVKTAADGPNTLLLHTTRWSLILTLQGVVVPASMHIVESSASIDSIVVEFTRVIYCCYYLRQGGNAFARLCFFVCLSAC